MKWFDSIFRKRQEQDPQPLRIGGVGEAPLTPEPDDAELAAQALLEMVAAQSDKAAGGEAGSSPVARHTPLPEERGAAYYRQLAEKIRLAHDAARLRTARFLTFCEEQLRKRDLPLTGPGSLGLLEAELYKRIDTADREGGDLKRRWQHCLAEVTVRLMQPTGK